MQTSMLPETRPDACLSRPPASSPSVTSTHAAHQVQNDYKEHDDPIDNHAHANDYDAPVLVRDNLTAREGVSDVPVVP